MLTFEQIKELAELVSAQGLGGLEVERSGFRLRIDGRPAAPAAPPASAAAPAAETAPPASGGERAPEESAEGGPRITSPIVGTFYRAPSPDAAPFVEVGSEVHKGQVVCIVEAMKLMNQIESEFDGVIAQVYPENGQPVEFGEELFRLRRP